MRLTEALWVRRKPRRCPGGVHIRCNEKVSDTTGDNQFDAIMWETSGAGQHDPRGRDGVATVYALWQKPAYTAAHHSARQMDACTRTGRSSSIPPRRMRYIPNLRKCYNEHCHHRKRKVANELHVDVRMTGTTGACPGRRHGWRRCLNTPNGIVEAGEQQFPAARWATR